MDLLWYKSLPLIAIKTLCNEFDQANFWKKSFRITSLHAASTRLNGGEQNCFWCRQTGPAYPIYFSFGFLCKIQRSKFSCKCLQVWRQQLAAAWGRSAVDLSRLTEHVREASTKKCPLIETHINFCTMKYYRDARSHWIQWRCCLESTGRRWVLASFTKSSE